MPASRQTINRVRYLLGTLIYNPLNVKIIFAGDNASKVIDLRRIIGKLSPDFFSGRDFGDSVARVAIAWG